MASTLATYDPSSVYFQLAGIYTLQGITDIKLIQNEQLFTTESAMDGSKSRIWRYDDGFSLEVSVSQASSSNNILTAMYNIDVATRMGKFPVYISDTSGSSKFIALTTWITKLPDVSYMADTQDRVWKMGCAQATLMLGGNEDSSLVVQALEFGASLLPMLKTYGVAL